MHRLPLCSTDPRSGFTKKQLLLLAYTLLCACAFLLTPCLQAQLTKGTVSTPDVKLAYESYGKAGTRLPIIAVNGGPGLTHAYMLGNDLWQRVAEHRLVVFYDQRGIGASRLLRSGSPQTMDAQVADLEAVRAALHLDRFALLGDSYGGFVAMAYATQHPEHVARLILSDAPGPSLAGAGALLAQVFPDIQEQDAHEEHALGDGTDKAAQAGLRDHFRMIFYSPTNRETYLLSIGDLGYVPSVAEAVSRAADKLDYTRPLTALHIPTLVLNGRYDLNVPPGTAWHLAHLIPEAKLLFFEQSGHLPSYEEPVKYRETLEAFLNGR